MLRILGVLVIIALFPQSVFAACTGGPTTWTVPTGTGAQMFADLISCLNQAGDGDEVVIEAGTVDFTSTIGITGKLITIRGQGPSLTTFRATNVCGGGTEGCMFWIGLKPGNFTLRDFTIEEGNIASLGQGGMILFWGDSNGLWMDNIVWNYRRSAHTLRIQGYVRGVVSRLTMYMHGFGTPIYLTHDSWGNIGSYGDNSWATATTFGTAEAFYIEDSVFDCLELSYCADYDSATGARHVLRRSTLIGPQHVNHGLATTERSRGTFQNEYYQNIARDFHPLSSHHPYPILSGTGIFWGNRGTNLNTSTQIQYGMLRSQADPPLVHRPYSPWGDCGTRSITQISCSGGTATASVPYASVKAGDWITILGSHANYNGNKAVTAPAACSPPNFAEDSCDHQVTSFQFAATCAGTVAGGTFRSPFDGNANEYGYLCMDQPAAGPGILFSGYNATQGLAATPANQTLTPLYDFLNTRDGSQDNAAVHGNNDAQDIRLGRDFFSYTGSTSVSDGVGVGPIASRPACTQLNTAYWATDEGEWDATDGAGTVFSHDNGASAPNGADGRLYTCDGAGTWSLYYTPYTYPHPLRSGGSVNTSPSLTINSPFDYTNQTASTVNITGTCVDDVACTGVTWANSNGGATTPLASLTASNWTVTGATVNTGTNLFTFTGSDGSTTGQDTLNILRRATVSALPFTDDCSASVAWPNLGPHYTRIGPTTTYAGMASGICTVTAPVFEAAAFSGFALNTNQYIKATIVNVSPFAQQLRLCVNMKGTAGQTDNFTGLWIQVDGTNSASNMISRYVGGALDHIYVSNIPDITVVEGTTTIEARRWNDTLTLLVNDQVKAVAVVTEVINGVAASTFDGGTAGPCPYGVGTQWDNVVIGNTDPPPGDVTPPDVAILVPSASSETTASTIAELSGTATDNVAVVSCTRDNNLIPGPVSITVGAGTFTASNVPVVPGLNLLTVRCLDAAGNEDSATVGVLQQSAPQPRLKRRPF